MRVEGWEKLLADHIAEAHRMPFVWGERDCALWATDWVKKATGNDHGVPWRGMYTTEQGAAKRIKKLGYTCVSDIADAHLSQIPVAIAQRGDLVLNDTDSLGICAGKSSYFITTDSVTAIPTEICQRAWKVG